MADIQPLRAWRYNQDKVGSIEELTSPLFDVVSEKQRAALYRNPYNSIHLSVPAGNNPAQDAASLLARWKAEGVLLQDALPAIYVYYQYFRLPGSDREFCRKGFIANIRVHEWEEQVLLRHENTIPHSVEDRLTLLEETQLNVSPTHGLYTDPQFALEGLMDESMLNPLYESEDYQGVRDVLSVIQDAESIATFIRVLKEKQIILADGHHRYESSLMHYRTLRAANPQHTGQESYNFHLMYLTNTESDDLRILPTHRVIQGLEHFSEEEMLHKLEPYFIIKALEDPYEIHQLILGKPWAFGLIFKDNSYKIRLKPEVFDQLSWKMPPEILRLDLTVLHFFVIEKALGIPGVEQRSSPHIRFERSFTGCVASVLKDEAQCAFVIKDISMDDVKRVCYSGYTMPQKSTYFYPKVICGFLYSSIQPDEFALPDFFRF